MPKKRKLDHSKKSIKFVVNTPMYVPADMSGDSSDEEDNGNFTEKFDFDPKNLESFPYRTFAVKKVKPKKGAPDTGIEKVKIIHQVGSANTKDIKPIKIEELEGVEPKGTRVKDFLEKLEAQAFVKDEVNEGELEDISVGLALNRKLSLSTRSNKSLKKEFKASLEAESPIKHQEIAFFWNVQWFDKLGKEVGTDLVRHFYKQLKRKDPAKADEFLRINESEVSPPYQELREILRLSEKTGSVR